MVKKLVLLALTVLIAGYTCEPVYAEDIVIDDEGEVSVPVRYTADTTSYTIKIPALITAGENVMEYSIEAEKINLRPDECVKVYISEGCDQNGTVTLTRQNVPTGKKAATLSTTFTIKNLNVPVSDNDYIVGYFEDSANSIENMVGSILVNPVNISDSTEAGDYSGTVTFAVILESL